MSVGTNGGMTRKGWTRATLEALGVDRQADGGFVIGTTGGPLVYYDDGRQPKTKMAAGRKREMWPAPETVTDENLIVVEGEADVLSMLELGYTNVVALPGISYKPNADRVERLTTGRTRIDFICDFDAGGRAFMRAWAEAVSGRVEATVVDIEPDRDDKSDIGDVLAEALSNYPEARRYVRSLVDDRIDNAEPIQRKPESPPKLIVLDTLKMVTTPPPVIEWLADGVFARGKLTLFGGREKGGKSLVQLAMGIAIASGADAMAGIPVTAGKVLLVDAENGQEEIHRRLRSLGLEAAHAARVVTVEARGFDLSKDLGGLVRLIDEHRPDLVLLDSFRSLWRGDERDEAEVADCLYPVSSLSHDRGIAIGLTHHAKKDGEDYRGSTAIGAVPDWIVMLAREHGDPLKAVRRRLSTAYARIAPERPDRWLMIGSDGDEGPVTLTECDPFHQDADTPVQDQVEAAMLDVIKSAVRSIETTAPHRTPTWSLAELSRAIHRDPKGETQRNALKRLVDRGILYADGKRWAPAPTLFDEPEE